MLGARASLAEAGLDPIKSLIEESVPGIGIQDGGLSAKQLLTQALPGGILCGNDMMAFGVYRGLTSAGVRIPEDVALIGTTMSSLRQTGFCHSPQCANPRITSAIAPRNCCLNTQWPGKGTSINKLFSSPNSW